MSAALAGTGCRKTRRQILLEYFEDKHEPVKFDVLKSLFGRDVSNLLRGLVFGGEIQRRRTFTSGRPIEYLGAGKPWPQLTVTEKDHKKAMVDSERERGSRRTATAKLQRESEGRQSRANEAANSTLRELRKPWPFYDPKFLPYLKFFDEKHQRRYKRAAKHHGHEVPE